MAAIEVNYKDLRELADAITAYCAVHDAQMAKMDTEVKSMLTPGAAVGWLGPDAQEFGKKWTGVNDKNSTAARLRDSLSEFGEKLAHCAGEYQKIQELVAEMANRLNNGTF